MHNGSDQLGKNILRDALSCASTAQTEVEVLAATQKIDVYSEPDPARDAERARMGLLGVLSAEPGLFEPFRNTPTLREVRRCVNKQHTWHHELERQAGARLPVVAAGAGASAGSAGAAGSAGSAPESSSKPFPALVVISPGKPETVLDAYGCQVVSPGVYHSVWGLVLRVVVAAELPRTRETLLLRLFGRRRVLHDALADLAALPSDAWDKSIVSPLLVHFRIGTTSEDEEDDVSAEIRAWYEIHQQKLRDEGHKEGRDEGRKEGERRVLLRQLRARFGELPAAAVARIEAADVAELERWADRVLAAKTLDEVLAEPS
jgi:hypothetical protein